MIWFCDDMKEAICLRDIYHSTNDTNWRFWRNKVNTLVKKGKTTYYGGLIEANMKDSKMLWNIVRDLAPKAKSALPVSLHDVLYFQTPKTSLINLLQTLL